MERVKLNYDNVLNPQEAFKDYLKRLLPIYHDDYGAVNYKIVKERLKKAIYIFDSLPIDEVNFSAEYGNDFRDKKKTQQVYDECKDFFLKKKQIDAETEKKFYSILAQVYGVGERYIDELFTIDIDSFGMEMQFVLSSSNVSESYKEEIRKRQDNYRKDCERLGVNCITDYQVIEKLFALRDEMDYKSTLLLAKKLKWIKRLRKSILKEYGAFLSDEQLVDLLFYSKTASCNLVDVGRKEKILICYFPLAKNILQGSVDKKFFHELRHVAEMSDNYSGLQVFSSNKYMIINELHTEKNACYDSNMLKKIPLFSSDDFVNNNWNVYQEMFKYTDSFFDSNRNQLNYLAVKNNVKEFERLYLRKNLKEFEKYLGEAYETYLNDTWMYKNLLDEERQKSLIRRLNTRYEARH